MWIGVMFMMEVWVCGVVIKNIILGEDGVVMYCIIKDLSYQFEYYLDWIVNIYWIFCLDCWLYSIRWFFY